MITLVEFDSLVQKYFSFLETSFDFVYDGCEDLPFMYYIRYIKKKLLVRIGLAYRHENIEVFIFENPRLHPPTSQDNKHSISLPELIYKKNKKAFLNDAEYEKLMPLEIGYNKSLEKISSLLSEYGRDILLSNKLKK